MGASRLSHRKLEILSSVHGLIIVHGLNIDFLKIANSSSEDLEEHISQCVHLVHVHRSTGTSQ